MLQLPEPDLTEAIPHPSTVRDQLGDTLRRLRILRQLLRLSERAERDRASNKAVSHA